MWGAIIGAAIGILVGVACIVIGILNSKGNISMLHSYHRNNVSEENKLPFGKLVGCGMIIVGVALIAYGALFIPAELEKNELYLNIGNIYLIIMNI